MGLSCYFLRDIPPFLVDGLANHCDRDLAFLCDLFGVNSGAVLFTSKVLCVIAVLQLLKGFYQLAVSPFSAFP